MITWPALADAVRLCASRPAGALHVAGRPGGVIRLREGAVVSTWTGGTPLAVPSPTPGSRPQAATAGPLARLAMTDAVFVMAAGRVTALRTEDDPGAVPEGVRMDLDVLLREVDRRIRRVIGPDGILPPEETVVRRLGRSGSFTLSPTPQESRLLAALDEQRRGEAAAGPMGSAPRLEPVRDGRTVRELAFALGRGVFGVLLDVQRLAAMGAVALSAVPQYEPAPALLVRARRDLDELSVATVSAALRRRRAELAGQGRIPEPPGPSAQSAPTLVRRVPGADSADRPRRRAPWHPRRLPDEGNGNGQ
ncbi:hypothetical protein [Pseudonocardia humida]|uniref:Uncharacterized protein n=1 Tax=Pseudonocardia humida TaxID=2800819 RepID=A0ABT1A6L6_9PSEU|nr:hypothetical protein [Pseudonocardia humida]MCO1658666.1 hypothetical protein [Pseudonocardia humida]